MRGPRLLSWCGCGMGGRGGEIVGVSGGEGLVIRFVGLQGGRLVSEPLFVGCSVDGGKEKKGRMERREKGQRGEALCGPISLLINSVLFSSLVHTYSTPISANRT